jgi:hypothetical protein
MAGNPIDLVVTTDALKGLTDLIARLEAADKALLNTVDSAAKLNKAVGTITTPQGLNANSSDNAQVNAQLKAQADIVAKLNTEIQELNSKLIKLNESKARGTKLTADEIVQNQELRKAAIAEAKANSDLIGSYDKLNLAHQKAVKNAQNLGATYGATSKEFINATEKANKLDAELKAIDATLGRHTRNVGNYSGKFNALGNSINQLTREAPAFANSMNTGFMAISNNIPAFTDAIDQLKENNKELIAQGQKPISIWKSLGQSLFTFNTLISVGVTLLTVYGAKLIEYAFNTDEAKASTDRLTKSLKDNEDQVNKNIKAIEHQTEIDIQLARKRGANEEEISKIRIKSGADVVTEYEKQYNKLNAQIDSFDAYRRLKNEDSGKAIMFLTEKYGGDVAKARQEYLRREKAYTDENRNLLIESRDKMYAKMKEQNDSNVVDDLTSQADLNEQKKAAQKKAAEDALKAEEDRLKDLAELRKKEIELELANIDVNLNNTEKYYTERLYYLQQDFLKRNELAKINYDEELRLAKGNQAKEKTALINFQLEKLKLLTDYNKKAESIGKLELKPAGFAKSKDEKDPMKQLAESAKLAQKALEGTASQMEKNKIIMEQMKMATQQWLGSFSVEFLQKSGMGSLQTFFDGTFNTLLEGAETSQEKFGVYFNAISETAQEAFNMIASYSQANFDAEYTRLESQKDIAIQFAGDSASAKKKIEEDFDKKKREIANREAKAKKKQAMFNIAIDTAQAVIGSLRMDPTGIMAIIIGAMGALQLGLVAAQKIPQYWKGTDHAQSGLAWTNEKGAEIHTDKYGNIKSLGDNKGARLTMMEQGDKVFTASESQRMLQDKMLNDMLIDRGISMNYNSNNTSLTYAQMKEIMNETLGNKPEKNIIFDKNGFSTYIRKSGNITRYTNQRAAGVGMTV